MNCIGHKSFLLRCAGYLAIIIFSLPGNTSFAQDPQFSQFYAASLYLNPAFAGNTLQGRFTLNYRNQWPSIPKGFISYAFSYDHNLRDLNSGLGLLVLHDKAGSGGLRFTSIGGLYSYNAQLSRKQAIRAGLRFSYVARDYDLTRLVFADQIARGSSTTIESNLGEGTSYIDLGAGMVFYSKNYWAGLAFDHLNKPNESLTGTTTELPIKTSLHAGYNIPVKRDIKYEVESSVTIAVNYKAQQKWDQLDIGTYYNHNALVIGMWYRGIPLLKEYQPGYGNNDALIVLVGVQVGGMRIGYSYDITISKLANSTNGSHEISLRYEYPNPKKKRPRKNFVIPCAKF